MKPILSSLEEARETGVVASPAVRACIRPPRSAAAREMPWMQTANGRAFDLLAPRAEDVVLEDYAHALARIARFNGATRTYSGYSVAQHSLIVADLLQVWGADAACEREGLLHDAAEAYYGDITSPVQRALREMHLSLVETAAASAMGMFKPGSVEHTIGEQFVERMVAVLEASDPLRELKSRIDPVVRTALGLPLEESPFVKRADLVALAIERKLLMRPCERAWTLPELADTRWTELNVMSSANAEKAFLARIEHLDRLLAKSSDE